MPVGAGAVPASPARAGELDAIEEVRLRAPMRHLPGEIGAPNEDPQAPVVLFPTIGDIRALRQAFDAARDRGQRVLLDSDVDAFAQGAHLIVADEFGRLTLAREGAVRAYRKAYAELVRAADGVTVAMPALAAVYREVGARQVFVCPNAIDPAQWAPLPRRSEYEWTRRGLLPPRLRDAFAVGFAGGPGHEADAELIRPALKWASAQKGVQAVLFGSDPGLLQPRAVGSAFDTAFPVYLRAKGWSFRYRSIRFTPSYTAYRQQLSGLLDVGLAPLTDSRYNRGRSDLKIAEYAMAGALPIVSDAPNYDVWRDTPVLFARDADEFLEHVQWAVTHREEARERAMAVRELVLERRTIETTIAAWRRAVTGL